MSGGDSAERIAQSLRTVLPEDTHHRVADLAALLADAASGRLAADEVRRRLAGSPDLAALLRDLADRHPPGVGSVVSIGDGSQLGDIQIGAVAGRDVFNLEQLVVLASLSDAAPAPKLSPSIGQYLDHLEADILQSFRQDTYVMLTVETLELDEPATADALRRTLRAEAEATLTDLGDELGIAWARYEQGEAYWVLGDLRRALERFEGCAVQLGTLGEHGWQVDCLTWQGNVLRAMGRLDVAERPYAAALQLVRQHRLLAHELRLLVWGLAENARRQGRHRRALELYAEAGKLASRLADPAQLAQVSMRMGLVALECREDDLAAEYWRACDQLLGDEARFQLEFLERLALRWAARAPGRRGRWHTRLGRMGVSLYQGWERISAPTSFLGRLFWRLGHWTARL